MQVRIYVDGLITAAEDAKVPVLDRGFLYGDSVYEVMWWHRNVIVQEDEHFERLRESARRLYLEVPFGDPDMAHAIRQTCGAAGVEPEDDAYVRLMVTRGAGPMGLELTAETTPSLVVVVAPAKRPTREEFEAGLRAAVVHRRRNPRDALDPRAKTGNYLNNVLALHEARLAGADEAIMLNERGEVAEATTANIYVVRGAKLATPPIEAGILKGTTRTRILALCAAHGIPHGERVIAYEDLLAANEAFLSSSVKGIRPVLSVDGRKIGDGRAGPVTSRLHSLFEAAADAEVDRAARNVRGRGDGPP